MRVAVLSGMRTASHHPTVTRSATALLILTGALGCSDPATDPRPERIGTAQAAVAAPLPEAFCTTEVQGLGSVATETDYLTNVINCEHGGADLETLKAQAVAARSFLYWKMGTYGSICDSTNCQVYSCGRTPDAIHQQAVDETSGVYLAYNGNVTCTAYLAGDPATAPPECVGGPADGPITYNEGLTGTDVHQTTLLWVHDPNDADYGQNRGCMSQNGASCLAEHRGYDYRQILRFYYGADIEMLQASGPCVLPLPNEGGAGGSGNEPPGTGGFAAGGGSASDGLDGSGAGWVSRGDPATAELPREGDGEASCAVRPTPRHDDLPSAVWLLAAALGLVLARQRRS